MLFYSQTCIVFFIRVMQRRSHKPQFLAFYEPSLRRCALDVTYRSYTFLRFQLGRFYFFFFSLRLRNDVNDGRL